MGRVVAVVVRAMLLALLVTLWPGASTGRLAGWPAPSVAQAGDDWCEIDPLLLIQTPAGNTVPVFYLTGAYGLEHAAATQLAQATYAVEPDAGGTKVTFKVTVPDDLFGKGFPTRVTVSSGPWGTLQVHGKASGTSGAPMSLEFYLDVP